MPHQAEYFSMDYKMIQYKKYFMISVLMVNLKKKKKYYDLFIKFKSGTYSSGFRCHFDTAAHHNKRLDHVTLSYDSLVFLSPLKSSNYVNLISSLSPRDSYRRTCRSFLWHVLRASRTSLHFNLIDIIVKCINNKSDRNNVNLMIQRGPR